MLTVVIGGEKGAALWRSPSPSGRLLLPGVVRYHPFESAVFSAARALPPASAMRAAVVINRRDLRMNHLLGRFGLRDAV